MINECIVGKGLKFLFCSVLAGEIKICFYLMIGSGYASFWDAYVHDSANSCYYDDELEYLPF